MPDRYRRLVFESETGDLELLSAALWEHGTVGIEELDDSAGGALAAYFAELAPGPDVDWSRYGARLRECEELEDRDWMAAYRERAQPLPVASRLLVDPREPEPWAEPPPDQAGRLLLRLPARTAFGTGSHASTRLAIELLEEIDLTGRTVLDVGAGSGILSFAAELFGAARVVGVEIDPAAALVAAQNRRLNNLFPAFVAGGVGALSRTAAFDLALVNVLPERIAADLEPLRRLMRPGAAVIFSGMLTESLEAVQARLAAVGFVERRRRASAEWTALETEVVGP